MRAVHPHACGDNWRETFVFGEGIHWFTPTRVGDNDRRVMSRSPQGTPVHPHACGDNRDDYRLRQDAGGSPPTRVGTMSLYEVR